ncbi:Formate hydrogenlyase transcriptional activator [Olavius algarvensis associated proteobacterium Delta 3]|nr:Formate hydrogenlyase transcriptional activator [Olavius algarvensis associated proteobacterium Delta 3]CAB5148031.1 Formate hydrogenlyase transcriptional activator [Olavius algarvensis associated proteobacterium Delta 3]
MVHIDANEFFREFTLRICSSLDIEKALGHCLEYIRGIMPADKLLLSVYKPDIGAIEVVAKAAAVNEEPAHLITALPPPLRHVIENSDPHPRVRIVENIVEDEMIGFVTKKFDLGESSAMISRLMIEGNLVGFLCVCAKGRDHYPEALGELWKLVNEPAAIALANSLRYRELLTLKELLDDDNRYFQARLREVSGSEIVGGHSGLKAVVEKVRKVATLDSPVLMLGETGVGKEVIANMIHDLSDRRSKPLITVNCGAIPDTLLDSELFGHERGAFTGALSQKRGRFERADQGTIFLDEIGELPLQAQTRLLRVLQSHEIERVGGMRTIPLDIRIIAATHRNLEKMVTSGRFREDLWFRLNVFPITIPPLRERREDIPLLLDHFLRKKSRELKITNPPHLSPDVIDRLTGYYWPGNVRELENVVERALIEQRGRGDDGSFRFAGWLAGKTPDAHHTSETAPNNIVPLDAAMATHIRGALEFSDGKIQGPGGAAELLGVNPTTLRSRMDRLGIQFKKRRA